MGTNASSRPCRIAVVLGGTILLTACLTSTPQAKGSGRFSGPMTAVITQDEIARTHATNAYDAIQLSRPNFLLSRSGLPPFAEREVYLDGMRLGGIEQLRGIAASSIREIRYAGVGDGGPSDIPRPAGAILVFSKVRR